MTSPRLLCHALLRLLIPSAPCHLISHSSTPPPFPLPTGVGTAISPLAPSSCLAPPPHPFAQCPFSLFHLTLFHTFHRSWYCDQPPGSFVSLVGRLLVSWAPVLLVTIWMGMLLPMASYLLVKVWKVWACVGRGGHLECAAALGLIRAGQGVDLCGLVWEGR